ncbi:MAG: hypothetical protein K4304_08445 [Propionicimonas sp.]
MRQAVRVAATIAHGTLRTDIALPEGTTVASLQQVLNIDTARSTIVLADGSQPAPDAVIGIDIPQGTLFTIAAGSALAQRMQLSAAGPGPQRSTSLTGAALAVLLGFGFPLAFLVLPLSNPQLDAGLPLRLASAAVALAAAAVLIRRSRATESLLIPLAVPALMGIATLAAVDPRFPAAAPIAAAAGLTAAAVTSFFCWQFGRGTANATLGLWVLIALVGWGAAMIGASSSQVGAALLCLGVGAVVLAPAVASPVPDSQLLDLELLRTAASGIRVPDPPKPTRITSRRARRTVATTDAVIATVALAGVVVAVVASVFLAPAINLHSLTGLTALAALILAAVGLALLPRGYHAPLMLIAPRVGAATITAVTAVACLAAGTPAALIGAALLALAAFGVVVGTAASQRSHKSALLGRIADIVQGVALGLLFPAALVASSTFELIWQGAS